MVLTAHESEEYINGNLSRETFLKVKDVADFDKYLFRYCKIEKDVRPSETERETTFILYGWIMTVYQSKGETQAINYQN